MSGTTTFNIDGNVKISAQLQDGLVEVSKGSSLAVDISSFKYDIGGQRGTFTGSLGYSVVDSDTSYLYLDSSAVLQSSTSSFPSVTHIPLAKVVAASGEVTQIYEERVLLASSTGEIGTCAITLPVDGDIKGGDAAASSNNNWAAVRYDGSGTAGEARNRLVRRFPKNYVSGSLTVRIVYTWASSIGNNKEMFWRCSYKFGDLGDSLGTMSSVTLQKDVSNEAADTLYYLDLTIPEGQVESSKTYVALYIAREYDDAQDDTTENCYVHNIELRYTGRVLAGQAGQ